MGNNRIIADLGNATRLAAASGSALVGFLQSGTGAVARTVQAKERDLVSVKDFGAIGDGVADDTAEIQAAIDAGLASNRSVFFPAGTYLISTPITLSAGPGAYETGVGIYGAGQRQTVIKCVGTAYVRSNQTQVNDNIQIKDLSILGNGTSAIRGLDIGTVRNGLFVNVDVRGFQICWSVRVNQGVANWWNRFYNCEAWSLGVAVLGTIGWELGNDGANVPTTGLPNIADLDYNDFYGCKSLGAVTAIKAHNIIGCVISGFQATSHTTGLVFDAGNNNDIEMVIELATSMGSAAAPTLANRIRLFNDGRLATDFVDNGLNIIDNQILGQPTLANSERSLDCFLRDRMQTAFTGLTKAIFRVTFTAPIAAATVTTTSSGYIFGTSEFASVQVWDIVRTGAVFTITLVRTTGTVGVLTAAPAGTNVTFTMAGNATNLLIGQVIVDVQGFGVAQVFPFANNLGYARL